MLIDGCIHLTTGISMGTVRMTVEVLPTAPAVVDARWEDIAEISTIINRGPASIAGLMETPDPTAPRLDGYGPGTYRFRIHARNQDIDYNLVSNDTAEEYLIQTWLAAEAPATIIASGSKPNSQSISSHDTRVREGRAVSGYTKPAREQSASKISFHNIAQNKIRTSSSDTASQDSHTESSLDFDCVHVDEYMRANMWSGFCLEIELR